MDSTSEGNQHKTPTAMEKQAGSEQWRLVHDDPDGCYHVMSDDTSVVAMYVTKAHGQLFVAAPALLAAVKSFLEKWPAAEKAINGALVMQHIHGGVYTGPNLGDDLMAMQAALAKAEGRA